MQIDIYTHSETLSGHGESCGGEGGRIMRARGAKGNIRKPTETTKQAHTAFQKLNHQS